MTPKTKGRKTMFAAGIDLAGRHDDCFNRVDMMTASTGKMLFQTTLVIHHNQGVHRKCVEIWSWGAHSDKLRIQSWHKFQRWISYHCFNWSSCHLKRSCCLAWSRPELIFFLTDIVNQLLNKNALAFGIEITVRTHTYVENYMLAFKNKAGLWEETSTHIFVMNTSENQFGQTKRFLG